MKRGDVFPGAFVEATLSHGEAGGRLPFLSQRSSAWVARMWFSSFPAKTSSRFARLDSTSGKAVVYEVVDGLAAGEEIAVAGVFLLKSTLVSSEGGED